MQAPMMTAAPQNMGVQQMQMGAAGGLKGATYNNNVTATRGYGNGMTMSSSGDFSRQLA